MIKNSMSARFFSLILVLIFLINIIPINSNAITVCNSCNYNNNSLFYSYDDLTILLYELKDRHPDIFSFNSIGETYEGRDIWLVKISDNVELDEDEPEVFYTGGIHGNEKVAFQVVIESIKAISENYSDVFVNESFSNRIKNIVNNTELYFVPMLNPDGCEACTRKNRKPNPCFLGKTLFRGVDLNRNFDYRWYEYNRNPIRYFTRSQYSIISCPFLDFWTLIDGPGNGTYRGPYPFSEKESKAIRDFVGKHEIKSSIDYHCCGMDISYPWRWTFSPTPDETIFLSIAENMSKYNHYKVKGIDKFQNTLGIGLLDEWLYGEHGVISFTMELASLNLNKIPVKESINDICFTHLLVNLYLAERTLSMN